MAQLSAQQQFSKLEQLMDRISNEILEPTGNLSVSNVSPKTVNNNQKTIRDGIVQVGRDISEKLVLYQKDARANLDDNIVELQTIANSIDFTTLSVHVEISDLNQDGIITPNEDYVFIKISDNHTYNNLDITQLLFNSSGRTLNVSQFIPLQQSGSIINVEQANEFLDTNIYELLPEGDLRQQRITRFFSELDALLPPEPPNFDKYNSSGELTPDLRVDRDEFGDWIGNEQYSRNNSISYSQENIDTNIDEEEAYFHRLKSSSIKKPDSKANPNNENQNKTIEDIYDRIKGYLDDILEQDIIVQDERQEYERQSPGYLQFRDLNQGIIIRNANQDFIPGLDPNNPTWLDTGFTITMWVRFLDKTSQGTLFNYGNPMRGVNNGSLPQDSNAFGFKLETYVLNRDDECLNPDFNTWGDAANDNEISQGYFLNSSSARFVRLVVRDFGTGFGETADGESLDMTTQIRLRDSHVGSNSLTIENSTRFDKLNIDIPYINSSQIGNAVSNHTRLLNTTFIPENFTEWYFICATYNPNILEDESHSETINNQVFVGDSITERTPLYWNNYIIPKFSDSDNYESTANSGYGNRCKVEIISRTDLLRARGFKVE
tara:strand:+ start:489 stop:2303 length:1815 start_codon:yes stop_codon:yes gene_type:complete